MNEIAGASLVLALLVAAEGVRRCTPGTVVLRRFGFGRWRPAPHAHLGSEFYLLSLCVPLALPVALEADGENTIALRRALTRARARIRRTRIVLLLLQILGLAILVQLAALPFMASRSGVWGLVRGLISLTLLCYGQAAIQYDAMRQAGARPKDAAAAALRCLWPFAAPGAAARVLAKAIEGVPALAAMHLLLGREAFLSAVRPMAYDALRRPDATGAQLLDIIDRQSIASFIQAPPRHGAGELYCPRCGSGYRPGMTRCADCTDIELVLDSAGLPIRSA